MSTHAAEQNAGAEPQTITQLFYGFLDDLERRARAQGLTLTEICKQSGVSRSTPDRWRKKLPKTLENVVQLEAVVLRAENKR